MNSGINGVHAGVPASYLASPIKPPRVRASKAEVERIGVTPEQIAAWNLPSRPTKASDSRARGFGDISVELDAIEPSRLRSIVQEVIERHLPPDQYEVLKQAEASERRLIGGLVEMLTRDGGQA